MRCVQQPVQLQRHGHHKRTSPASYRHHRSCIDRRAAPTLCRVSTKLVLRETRGNQVTTYTLSSSPTGPSTLQQTTSSHDTPTAVSSPPKPSEATNGVYQPSTSSPFDSWLVHLRDLYLPAGYPASVTPDYLPYQLMTVPAHITGWLSHSLVTSSLLKAVGVDAGPAAAVASSAAIKWIVKDGLGAVGRLFVGGRLGREFDDDPCYWRMVAEAVATVGLALEIATSVYPSQFLLLASMGTFARAVGKGMGKPVLRVILNHFAAAGNVGAVAAKEEVWEVSAQLVGYAASVALLELLQGAGSWTTVVGTWAGIQAVHVGLRYLALSQLSFNHMNLKRAALLVTEHVRSGRVLTVTEANRQEFILQPAAAVTPRVQFGVSLQEAWDASHDVYGQQLLGQQLEQTGRQQQQQQQHQQQQQQQQQQQLDGGSLEQWLQMYQGQGYWLQWRDGVAWVVLEPGYQPQVLLQALWQAAWLQAHDELGEGITGRTAGNSSSSPAASRLRAASNGRATGDGVGGCTLLQQSMQMVKDQLPDFLQQLQERGWDVGNVTFQVGPARLSLQKEASAEAQLLSRQQ